MSSCTHNPNCSRGRGWRFTLCAVFFFTMFVLLSLPNPPTVGSSGANSLSDSVTALQQCVIFCPSNVDSWPNDPNQCGAVVNYPPPTVVGPCSWMCWPPPGAFFQVGTTGVVCAAIDPATGQSVAACSFTVTVNDTQPPEVSVWTGQEHCGTNTPLPNDPGQCGAIFHFAWGWFDNCGVATYVPPPNGLFWPPGTHTFTFTVIDIYGNTTICLVTITVEDREPPTITCPGDITVANDPGQCGATVSASDWVTARDNCAVGGIACGPMPPNNLFPVGTSTITCTATDIHGNPSPPCQFTVTVNDTEPPHPVCGGISGPGDVTVSNDLGQCGAMVGIEAEAPDNCGLGTIHCSHEGRVFFPVGTTTVTCTATDASGNTGTCSFTVTVDDTEAPTLTSPQDIVTTNDPRRAEANVNYPMPSAQDNCSSVQVNCSPPPNTSFPIGTTQVTCTGTDAAHNTASCSFAVKVMPVWPTLVSSAFQIRSSGASESPDSAEQAPTEPGLVMADCLTDEVKAFVSNRDGTFRLSQRLRVGDMPGAVAGGDFNRDGNTDVATANLLSDDVSILLGNGDGSFRQFGSAQVGRNPRAIVAGDFTSDGRLDLAVVNLGDNDIMLLRGHGDGSFQSGIHSAVDSEPTAIVAGDFNRDNRLDLAVSNFGSDTITVLMNQGDGRFTPSGRFPVGAGPMALTAGDFDTDGRLDIATANFISNTASILRNTDGQRFLESKRLPTSNGPVALVADRLLNQYWGLATVNLLAGEMVIRLGDATGTLSTSQRYAVTAMPSSLVVADFNTDGRLDIAVLDADGMTLRVFLDNGDGTFRQLP